MEAFVLSILTACFIAVMIIAGISVIETIKAEDPLEKMLCGLCAALFVVMLLAITFISLEFSNYIGGIL